MTKTPQKRLPPFAIESLFTHPAALALPAAGFGMLCRLLFHFIMTDCRPIPRAGDELAGIMRAHRPTMRGHQKQILVIFDELAPEIIKARKIYEQRLQRVRELGENGRVSQRLRAITNKPTRPNADSALAITAPKRERTAPITRPLTRSDSAWRE